MPVCLIFPIFLFLFSRHDKRPPIRSDSTFRHKEDPRPDIKHHIRARLFFLSFLFLSAPDKAASGLGFSAKPPQQSTIIIKAEVQERWRGSGGGGALELVPIWREPGSRGGWTSVPWVLFTFKTQIYSWN